MRGAGGCLGATRVLPSDSGSPAPRGRAHLRGALMGAPRELLPRHRGPFPRGRRAEAEPGSRTPGRGGYGAQGGARLVSATRDPHVACSGVERVGRHLPSRAPRRKRGDAGKSKFKRGLGGRAPCGNQPKSYPGAPPGPVSAPPGAPGGSRTPPAGARASEPADSGAHLPGHLSGCGGHLPRCRLDEAPGIR